MNNKPRVILWPYPPFRRHSNYRLVVVLEALRLGRNLSTRCLDAFRNNSAFQSAYRTAHGTYYRVAGFDGDGRMILE